MTTDNLISDSDARKGSPRSFAHRTGAGPRPDAASRPAPSQRPRFRAGRGLPQTFPLSAGMRRLRGTGVENGRRALGIMRQGPSAATAQDGADVLTEPGWVIGSRDVMNKWAREPR